MNAQKVQDLAERVKTMSPADRLRLAAGLIEHGEYTIARTLVDQIGGELALLSLTRGMFEQPKP